MAKPKNILFFVTDDHAAWALQHAGAHELITPNLDAFAEQGTRFSQAFTPSPVCSPARACLMTGLPPSATGIHDWLQEYDDGVAERSWLSQHDTLPQMFRQAGYHTMLSGKWHLGCELDPPAGFDRAFSMARLLKSHNWTDVYTVDGQPICLGGNRSTFITDYALRFLAERPDDQPFFLNMGYFATHSPFVDKHHSPEVVSLFEAEKFNQMPREQSHPWAKNENGPNPAADEFEEERRSRWRGYAAAVAEIDREVGRLINYLQDIGEYDNTLIVYTSDHGLSLGHHGVWGKGNGTRPVNFYETNLRVPLIASGEGFAPGATCDLSVSHYDTFQVLANVAGVVPQDQLPRPGRDLRELTGYSPAELPDATYHEYGDARAIRTPENKLICRYGNGPDELFDLVQDPEERHPIPPVGNDVADQLKARLDDFYALYEDPQFSGRRILELPLHNHHEPWRDGRREELLNAV